MNIVFVGASNFGLRCLEVVQDLGIGKVVGVVTAPQNFNISYSKQPVKNVLYANFEDFCNEKSLPCTVMQGGMNDPDLFEKVTSWKPDMFLVAGWYHMVPKSWRNLAPAYGLHASLLPDYSGGAPLVWAMINSENKTGITFFQFDDGVDSGPIVGMTETDIRPDDTIKTLYDRIEGLGISLIQDYLPGLCNDTAVLRPQDESKRRVFPQRSPADGEIDWQQPALKIHDFIRAQTKPYPGAFTFDGDDKIFIWSAEVSNKKLNNPAGTITHEIGASYVVCGDGLSIELKDFEKAGNE